MDRAAAIAEIQRIFGKYRSAQSGDKKLLQALTDGKLYELYVLADVLEAIRARGFTLAFTSPGGSLKFKASPGKIKTSDPHFEVTAPGQSGPDFWIFVDIEFETFGQTHVSVTDNSRRHEIDIVVVSTNAGYPGHGQIALGVECKAVANFNKGLLKEALGVRRELGALTQSARSILSVAGGTPSVNVPMNPASEYWLAFIDGAGLNYAQSPAAFGIELRHIEP